MAGARSYTPAQEAEVQTLASQGLRQREIARRTGIHYRTVSRILARPESAAAVRILTEATRQDVASALWEVVAAGSAEALRRIQDPKTRAGELAQLLKVAAEQHALLTGGATARNENLNLNAEVGISDTDRAIALEWLDTIQDASDEELAEWAANGGLVHIRDHWTPRGVAKQQFLREQGEGDDA